MVKIKIEPMRIKLATALVLEKMINLPPGVGSKLSELTDEEVNKLVLAGIIAESGRTSWASAEELKRQEEILEKEEKFADEALVSFTEAFRKLSDNGKLKAEFLTMVDARSEEIEAALIRHGAEFINHINNARYHRGNLKHMLKTTVPLFILTELGKELLTEGNINIRLGK